MTSATLALSPLFAQRRITQSSYFARERMLVIALVVLLHATVFGVGLLQPEQPSVIVDEMSVSLAQEQSPQVQVQPVPQVKPEPEQKPVEKEAVQPEEKKPEPLPVAAAPVESKPAAPVVADSQPDFQADYLNNPRPPYPMVARRMGYYGKVVLNVEVLAEGRAGQVLLYSSSGHDVLDKAALQTVKSWRFNPARHMGQPVTEWFLVPINFSLEDSKA